MRILLLSCNTGEGHNSTAKAIMGVLEARGVECELRDVLACLSPRFSKFVCNWHARLYRYAPKLSDVGYRAFERGGDAEETTPVYELLALGAGKLWEMLLVGNYDAVVCVHVFSGMMMTEARKIWGIKLPCYFVATDYTCSPMVEQCEMDAYFIPAGELAGEFIQAGLPEERLIPSGIPVRQEFYRHGDKSRARALLGLPETALMSLLMCGSMGCGPMRKIAKDLVEEMPENAMVVAICGNNEKLYESLADIDDPRMRVLGYTKEIAEYMDAADMIVTKPGGLSATEAANKHLPMVFINAVGGCEGKNFDFFLSHGYAIGSDNAQQVISLATDLAREPERLVQMTKKLEAAFTGNSAQLIADRVMSAATRYHEEKAVLEALERINQEISGHPACEEGGCTMEQNHNETLLNLARSFAGESQARSRYTIYAKQARKEGQEWIARVFEKTADNEAVHAEEFLEMLQKLGGCADNIDLSAGYPFQLGTTEENLAFAAEGELHEHDEAYPAFAEMARREGCDDAARLWMQIARIEGVHHNAFQSLYEQVVNGTLTEKETPIVWQCLSCGYTYESTRACDPCPVCGKEAGWQEGQLDDKKIMQKK